jgi:SAM-dependent methyltransferase
VKLEPRYFDRMATGLGDKARMLPFLLPGRLLDVGSGGGELASSLASVAGIEVTALDMHPDSVARLRARPELAAVVEAMADQAPALLPPASFDTIVCCSVLHEVYSYGSSTALTRFDALDETMAGLVSLLRIGGRLVIRDGVMPAHPAQPASVSTDDPAVFDHYLALSPHPELALEREGDTFHGTRHTVSEAVFTVGWGESSLAREALERFELFTLDGYTAYAEGFGLRMLHASSVTQPGYLSALAALDIRSNGEQWFPETNALWVFERTA